MEIDQEEFKEIFKAHGHKATYTYYDIPPRTCSYWARKLGVSKTYITWRNASEKT